MKLLKTRDAKSVYRQISTIIKSYIVTNRAKEEFSLNLTNDAQKIKEMHGKIKKYDVIDDFTLDKTREILRDFELKESRNFFVDRVIATEDEEIYEKLFHLKKHCIFLGNVFVFKFCTLYSCLFILPRRKSLLILSRRIRSLMLSCRILTNFRARVIKKYAHIIISRKNLYKK